MIRIRLEHAPAPDAKERLIRAFALILRRAAERAEEQGNHQVSAEETHSSGEESQQGITPSLNEVACP